MLNKKKFNLFLLISIFIITSFSLYQINFEDLWYDEIATFWYTNPNYTNIKTYDEVLNHDAVPPFYYFFIKLYLKMLSYNPDILRYPNLIFNILSLFVFFKILNLINVKNKNIYFGLLIFSLNYFLISYSQEARVYSFYCLIVLLFIYSYLKLKNTSKDINDLNKNFFFFLSGTFALITHIFSYIVFFSILIFHFLQKNNLKKEKIFLTNIVLIFMFSTFLNYDFFLKMFAFKTNTINQPGLNFYLFNFYFKQFFGSKIMGFIFFLFFIYSIYKIKIKKRNDTIVLFLIIVFLSYFLPILYGYLFQPVLRDRYIIYIVPIIIIIISYSKNFYKKNFRDKVLIFLVFISFINLFFKIYKNEINKPQFTSLISEMFSFEKKDIIYFKSFYFTYTQEDYHNKIINNYLTNKKLNGKKLIHQDKYVSGIWIICYDPTSFFDDCIDFQSINKSKLKIQKKISKHLVSAYYLK